MKYKFIALLFGISIISLTACGNTTETVSNNNTVTESMETEKTIVRLETIEGQIQVESTSTELKEISTEIQNSELTEIIETTEVQINSEPTEIEEVKTEVKEEEVAKVEEPQVKELNKTMYAKQSVNVRKGDSTDYEKIGSLSLNQQVKVTGQSETTGWYRIEFNGETGFVSNNYLSTEKTVVTTPPVSNTDNNNQSGSNNQGSNTNNNNNSGGGNKKQEIDEDGFIYDDENEYPSGNVNDDEEYIPPDMPDITDGEEGGSLADRVPGMTESNNELVTDIEINP